MIEVENKKVPHSFRNKYLRNSGSVSFSTSTPTPTNGGGVTLDVLKVDDGRVVSDDNVFSSLRTLLEIKSRIIALGNIDTALSNDNTLSSLRIMNEILSRIIAEDDTKTKLSDENVFSSLRTNKELDIISKKIDKAIESLKDLYVSKVYDDTAKGHIILDNGATSDFIQSKNFVSGALGTGYLIKRDPNTGKSYAEVDELYVRLRAIFDSIEIKEAKHVSGELILSSASIKCAKVDNITELALCDMNGTPLYDINDVQLLSSERRYRCYFTADDGEKAVLSNFVIGDFAQCRQFNIKEGAYEGVTNRYYWRYVMAIGDNYIDLSVDDCDVGSDIPQAGDTIIQLGNRTDISRQNAIVLSAFGDNAPSKVLYQGINSYSLDGKAVIEEGFDQQTKQAYTRTFGRSYVGERDESSYMKYVPGEGLTARCSLLGMSNDGKSVYELKPDGTCFFGTTDPDTGKKTGIIQGVDVVVDGGKRTGVFAVVDDKIVFELDPVRKQYSFTGTISAENGDFGTFKIEGDKGVNEEGRYDNRRITFAGPKTDGILASMENVDVPLAFPIPYIATSGGKRNVGMYLKSDISDTEDMWMNKTLIAYGNAEFEGILIQYGGRFKCGLDLETRRFVRKFTASNEVQELINSRYIMYINAYLHNTYILHCNGYSNCKLILPEYKNFDLTDYARNGGNLMSEFKFIAHPTNKHPITIQSNPDGSLTYTNRPTMYNQGTNIASIQLSPGGCVSIALALFRDNEGDKSESLYYRAIVTNVY